MCQINDLKLFEFLFDFYLSVEIQAITLGRFLIVSTEISSSSSAIQTGFY